MIQYTVTDAKTILEGKIHDQSLNKIGGSIYTRMDEAIRNLLLSFDFKETKNYAPLSTAVYPDINRYIAPSDMKGEGVITLRKISDRTNYRLARTSVDDLRFGKGEYNIAVDFDKGIKILELDIDNTEDYIILNEFDSLSANGTPSVSGTATAISLDKRYFMSGESSIKVQLGAAGGSGILTMSGITKQDLSNYRDIFTWFKLPALNNNASPITTINLRFGSDASNYHEVSATSPFNSDTFKPDFNLVRFNTENKTTTGNPDLTNITYLRYEFIYPVQAQDIYVNIDQCTAKNGYQYELGYYTINLFKDAVTGELKDRPTEDTDLILLEKDSFNLFIYELSEIVAQEIQGEDSSFDIKYFQAKNKEQKTKYGLRYPSEAKKKQNTYYKIFRK